MKAVLRFILLPLAILILSLALFLSAFFAGLEHKSKDSLFRLRAPRPLSGDIVIIAIDDATDSALDTRWPYPREYHAKLIDNLFKLGVKQVVFDVSFTESSHPEADKLLADTAFYHQNTIFAGKLLRAERPGEPSRLQSPIKAIRNHQLSWGLVNISSDADNVIRQYTLFEKLEDTPHYTIGIASLANERIYQSDWAEHIAAVDGKLKVAGKSIPILHRNRSLINYFGPAGYFPYISYSSVLDDSTVSMPGYMGIELDEYYDLEASGELQGKIALVGASIDELHDNFPTPLGGKWMPGVEIHANFLEMARTEAYLNTLSPWLSALILFCVLLILNLVFHFLKPQYSLWILLLIFGAQYFIAWGLFSRQHLLIPLAQSFIAYFALYLVSLISHYLKSLKEKRFIRSAFQQYLAPELVNELLKDPGKISYGGSHQHISVLFSDIRGFTTFSEKHGPQETVNALREYLTAMVSVITANNGILDKFVGDAVMALFGTPLPLADHAFSACKCALEMQSRLKELNAKWQAEGRDIFEIGIGINSGEAVVGNLGSEQIFDYTAIGDTVNLGARLEAINKDYSTQSQVIISEYTYELVKDKVIVNYLDEVKVKGKDIAVKIYELSGLKNG
ncbi:MAG: adenylate/guanylate cyclase domain-containing protein [Candidatus Cloacimonetes bacterium]|nr:adenylate/guanylate cyclase domain-containing protein [Candidatus Cloacimonadota bacterium]